MKMHAEAFHRRIADLLSSRQSFVIASIVEIKGSSPQQTGARILIHPDGSIESTIGGGAFEAEVIRDGLATLSHSDIQTREYRLTKSEMGMYCQGLVRVFFEVYRPRPRLMIFGGGHVGQSLCEIASATRLFEVMVVDDREKYASRKVHPCADQVIHTDRTYQKGVPDPDCETYAVIVTRCHSVDKNLVKNLLDKPLAYLGLIGSDAKIRQFRAEMLQEGISATALAPLHAPIGLPIGGKDPAEVALSILAEVVQVKNQRSNSAAVSLHLKARPG